MANVAAENLWRVRLTAPAYQVSEAARYARTSIQTVGNWQKVRGNRTGVVSPREHRAALSYLQLIEVGVVAAMRKSGVRLPRIREAREYLVDQFKKPFPFAEYRFKTDGKRLLMDYDQILGPRGKGKLLAVNENGQLAWTAILSERLQEFGYDASGSVLSWLVDGLNSPVRVDPRIAFGAPQVGGIATWVLKERWVSGESLADIAEDYMLEPSFVVSALRFEGVQYDPDRPRQWVN